MLILAQTLTISKRHISSTIFESYFKTITHGPPIPSFSTRIHKSSHQSSCVWREKPTELYSPPRSPNIPPPLLSNIPPR